MSTTFQRRPDARRVGRCRRPTPAVLQQLSAGKPTCVDFGVCVGTVGQTKVTFGVMHHHFGVENAEHLRALRLVPNTSAATLSRYRVSSSWLGLHWKAHCSIHRAPLRAGYLVPSVARETGTGVFVAMDLSAYAAPASHGIDCDTLASVVASGDEDATIVCLEQLNHRLLLGQGRLPLKALISALVPRLMLSVSQMGDTLAFRALHNLLSLNNEVTATTAAEHPRLLEAVCTRLQTDQCAVQPDLADECLSMCVRVPIPWRLVAFSYPRHADYHFVLWTSPVVSSRLALSQR